jgi:hypothetical protein
MTIPSTYTRNTVGGAFTAQKIGGVIVGITSATDTTDGPITEVFGVSDNAIDGVERRTKPIDTAATVEALGVGTGTFAYNQVAFMFRGNQASNTINGSASTELKINGNEASRDRERSTLAPVGAQTSTAWRNGSFEALGVAGQRHPWGSGIPTTLTGTNYHDGFGSATTVDDAVGTDAVPGELAYMYGAITANSGEYDARTLS